MLCANAIHPAQSRPHQDTKVLHKRQTSYSLRFIYRCIMLMKDVRYGG
jgi:hypothetical protein